jgi:hypothetical protein
MSILAKIQILLHRSKTPRFCFIEAKNNSPTNRYGNTCPPNLLRRSKKESHFCFIEAKNGSKKTIMRVT